MNLSKSTKIKVFKRDGYKCLLCHTKKHLTIDHILPRSMGGSNHIDNLQTLCEYHNKTKGNNSVKDYRNKKSLPVVDPYLSER